jgi:hypothetical protein
MDAEKVREHMKLDEAFTRADVALQGLPSRPAIADILRTLRTRVNAVVAALSSPATAPAPVPGLHACKHGRFFNCHACHAPVQQEQTQAARDVLAERERQISAEGWTPEHDDEHDGAEMAAAASGYALAAADVLHPYSQGDGGFTRGTPPPEWPDEWIFKPAEPRRMLVKAGALILAEIERLDRAARTTGGQNG